MARAFVMRSLLYTEQQRVLESCVLDVHGQVYVSLGYVRHLHVGLLRRPLQCAATGELHLEYLTQALSFQ